MKKPGESKITIDLSRRRLIASGSVFLLSAVAALQGCTTGNSSHRKNWLMKNQQSRSATTATRLQFDFADGFNKLNAIRRRNFLPEFQNDPRLQKAAQDYANLMGHAAFMAMKLDQEQISKAEFSLRAITILRLKISAWVTVPLIKHSKAGSNLLLIAKT
jgi:hypothetical protein